MFIVPGWTFASNTSRDRRADYFFWGGCRHAMTLCIDPVARVNQSKVEDKWNALVETLLTEYTARWTETERETYRAKLAAYDTKPA